MFLTENLSDYISLSYKSEETTETYSQQTAAKQSHLVSAVWFVGDQRRELFVIEAAAWPPGNRHCRVWPSTAEAPPSLGGRKPSAETAASGVP